MGLRAECGAVRPCQHTCVLGATMSGAGVCGSPTAYNTLCPRMHKREHARDHNATAAPAATTAARVCTRAHAHDPMPSPPPHLDAHTPHGIARTGANAADKVCQPPSILAHPKLVSRPSLVLCPMSWIHNTRKCLSHSLHFTFAIAMKLCLSVSVYLCV